MKASEHIARIELLFREVLQRSEQAASVGSVEMVPNSFGGYNIIASSGIVAMVIPDGAGGFTRCGPTRQPFPGQSVLFSDVIMNQ